jgi:hypothetical protein
MAELKKLQKDLKSNDETKKQYVNARQEESSEESGDELRIVAPRRSKKSQVDTMLVEELVHQQKMYVEAGERISELSMEVDREETKNRYLTLDLSNAQLKIEELSHYQKETWILRALIAVYILFRLFCFYHWVSS